MPTFKRHRIMISLRKSHFVLKRCLCLGASYSSKSSAERDVAVKLPSTLLDAWPSAIYQRFAWMGHYGPCFPLRGEQISVLTEPTQFYEVLKVKAKKAKKRITLASLYLGTGSLEKELVSCVHEACSNAVAHKEKFKVNVLLDMTRGSRGKVNSRTMLKGLLHQFPQQVSVSLYHTPDLRGVLKAIVPERFNEVIGLTHLKVYLVDDSLIISGANLSNDYFTNRQDRYILFNDCKDMADFFDELVKTVASFSFQLQKDDTLQLHSTWETHPYLGRRNYFKWAAKERIESLLRCQTELQKSVLRQLAQVSPSGSETPAVSRTGYPTVDASSQTADTWVYPLVQMGPFGVYNDEHATLQLLREATRHDEILLASGYFNLTDHYMSVILQESLAKYRLMMAAPEVNGFFRAKGIAGYIPAAYIYIARTFFEQVQHLKEHHRIQLYEYFRENWTFHAKGLWYYLPQKALPSLTLIGSPNFGYRSACRDLECQVALVTENEGLQRQLREEHVRLYQSSVLVSGERFQRADRRIPLWVTYVTGLIKNFF
ncbi:CDP-diacylglycerol--glycerol-3-phosphate 3-phosphatidyltransferase, mitochondrial-like [Babylonia areolata]|uniref:CDP-diacylglycerol--glycerol-3-phosphate 3-phosphatidyltransferase, mitochondrial-like n=1 Tax=Babylonia areolata TaxID=304850 RepID=UPI003FD0329A